MPLIPYGAFRPDVGGPNTGFAAKAINVRPKMVAGHVGYGPFPNLVTASGATALSGAPKGMITISLFDGSAKTYAATASTIEEMAADYTWSAIDSSLTVPDGDVQSFVHFGSYLLNSNRTDGFKAYNVESPGTNDAVSGAPAARALATCNNVVFAFDCNGNNRRMMSSGIGDHTAWSTGTKGANGITLTDGGALLTGHDLKNGAMLVFQTEAMRLVQFGGASDGSLYSIAKVADGRGSVGVRASATVDGMVFYLDTTGFYLFSLGGGNVPIGAGKVNDWFFERINVSDLPTVSCVCDPASKTVMWRYRSVECASETVFNDIIGFDWQLQEWFTGSFQTAELGRFTTPGYTVDSIDVVLEDLDVPLDSRYFDGGQPVLAALNSDYEFATFTGGPAAATLETCFTDQGNSILVTRSRPLDDSPDGTVALGTKSGPTGTTTWDTARSRLSSRDDRVNHRGRGIELAFRRAISAGSDWHFAAGVDVLDSSTGGQR